ncbi:hypothetical protein E2C04_09740 [Nocardioides daphniae]|uniref:BREX system serine/threonine kinase PglW n=1 Tax=Nocardioides daphniae TaxID=402297 RepID=A0A4P7UCY1_9ACTN|nr:NERD domain-containing protein kinase family protein [Nocardioides daphniae]QCC77391.1 hypothetical protein E2C04_09740 [Nocardioides daphniae]
MKPDSPNWILMGEPASPAEQAALDAFRELLPEDGLTRAWVNLTFLDLDGRAAEVDVLLLTKRGFFVVELKGWHGTVAGNQQSWHQITPGGQVRHYSNPLKLTISKAKRLKSLLQQVNPNAPVPYLGALVVMHGHGSSIELDGLGRTNVLALDGYQLTGGLPTLGAFLASQPDNPHHIVDRPTATAARKACDMAGFTATPRQRRIGQYVLDDGDPVAVGQDWQDFVVSHPVMDTKRRLRLFDLPPQSSPDERERIEASARRELRLTEPLHHDGVDRPLDYLVTDSGPALLFDDWPGAQPLDQFLASRGDSLDFDTRIALIRQIGEVLRYTHNRHLAHRALAPNRVWVREEDSRGPRIRIRDWYTGQREASTRTKVTALSAGLTDVRGAVDQDDWIYLAREALHGAEELPSIPLDVYGLGALAFLILTGEPPATTLADLQARFTRDDGLDPSSLTPEIPDQYADVVRRATAFAEPERTASVDQFLTELDAAARAVRPAERDPQPVADPLDAQSGSVIADRFDVLERRGRARRGRRCWRSTTTVTTPVRSSSRWRATTPPGNGSRSRPRCWSSSTTRGWCGSSVARSGSTGARRCSSPTPARRRWQPGSPQRAGRPSSSSKATAVTCSRLWPTSTSRGSSTATSSPPTWRSRPTRHPQAAADALRPVVGA